MLDLSGTWVRVDSTARPSVAATGDAAFQRGDAGSGWGSPLTITQRDNKLVVEYQVFSTYDLQPPLQLTFSLDGLGSTNTMMLGHTSLTIQSTAAWEERGLAIVSRFPAPAARDMAAREFIVIQLLHFESPGTLLIDTARKGIAGAADVWTRTRYTRQ